MADDKREALQQISDFGQLQEALERVQRLQALCAAIYQVTGAVGHDLYGEHWPAHFEKAMDLLGAAGNGEAIDVDPIEALLPYPPHPEPTVPTAAGARILPAADPRVETGTVQFGDDWPGLFVRGKHAFWYAGHLKWAIAELEKVVGVGEPRTMEKLRLSTLRALLRDLEATRVKPRGV